MMGNLIFIHTLSKLLQISIYQVNTNAYKYTYPLNHSYINTFIHQYVHTSVRSYVSTSIR